MAYYHRRKKRKKMILQLSLVAILGLSLCLSIINFKPQQQTTIYTVKLDQAKICLPKAKNNDASAY